MERNWWSGPLLLAFLITLFNAAKPAVVDDTAYLLFARHIANEPLNPYGFELFWYRQPEPAMKVLLPPVLPYWLGLGMFLFGENLFLLKLWLFPFLFLFCLALAALIRRFARGSARPELVLLSCSPFILPFVNVMLDLPALALGLATIAVFLRGCERRNWLLAASAGVLAALAAQTKYTMIVLPAVLILSGLLHRRPRLAFVAAGVAVLTFCGWELLLHQSYGSSHFLYHAREQNPDGRGFTGWLDEKFVLWRPLLGFLGGLAGAWGLAAARAVGGPRWLVAMVGGLAASGILAVCLTPLPDPALLPASGSNKPPVELSALVFYSFGAFVLGSILFAAGTLAFRRRSGPAGWLRRDPASWILLGWLVLELGSYFVLTPFPAGRRVLTVCVVVTLIVCRLESRVWRIMPDRRPGRWIVGFGLASGLGLFALDWWDSIAEKDLVNQSAEVIASRGGGRVWTQGHWGWQYYTDQLGWELVVPEQSGLRTGDWLVVPIPNGPSEFYRPHHGYAIFRIPPDVVDPVSERAWEDILPARTIPTLYGGSVPIVGRAGPRLKVAIYQVRTDWTPSAR